MLVGAQTENPHVPSYAADADVLKVYRIKWMAGKFQLIPGIMTTGFCLHASINKQTAFLHALARLSSHAQLNESNGIFLGTNRCTHAVKPSLQGSTYALQLK